MGNLFPSNVDRGSVLTPRLMSTRQRHINVQCIERPCRITPDEAERPIISRTKTPHKP
ncbi:hypothetical protein M405DRAFT_288306 [Rhizopogon salebrosus TDB-379]|nr:hypothetical protein M405DRAFT_288306 [Rhizopogon salebrosus TDB-379]